MLIKLPRIRFRRLIAILVVLCAMGIVLKIYRSYQPTLIATESGNTDFVNSTLYTRFWRLPNVLIERTLSSQEIKDFEREYLKINIKKREENKYSVSETHSLTAKFNNRLWFFNGGQMRPKAAKYNETTILWPEQDTGDRIVSQLMYIPLELTDSLNKPSAEREIILPSYDRNKGLKKILLFSGLKDWNKLPHGRKIFLNDKCPVNTCTIFTSKKDAETADAIIFKNRFIDPAITRHPNQVWILYLLENPKHTPLFKNLNHVINWTATYRRDSDIVTPYEKFVPYNISDYLTPHQKLNNSKKVQNYAAGKTKMVAAFISNCIAQNGRLQYAYKLGHYINVDIYGACGKHLCPRSINHNCMKKLDKDYKFYLAFENSNCKDYITEKFFVNGLSHNVVPVVMGAEREDYTQVAPPHSYIHVDDFASPKDLAEYLKLLDRNDTLYNEYFSWKGSGEFVNTYFWCRLCALLHAPPRHKSYADIHDWWNKRGTCNPGR